MEFAVSFVVGLLSGLIYNEHIYRQSVRGESQVLGFALRFLFTSIVGIVIAYRFGAYGVLLFFGGNLIARFIHTLVRGVLIVRYRDGGIEQSGSTSE